MPVWNHRSALGRVQHSTSGVVSGANTKGIGEDLVTVKESSTGVSAGQKSTGGSVSGGTHNSNMLQRESVA